MAKYDRVKVVILKKNYGKCLDTIKCDFEAKLKALVCNALKLTNKIKFRGTF